MGNAQTNGSSAVLPSGQQPPRQGGGGSAGAIGGGGGQQQQHYSHAHHNQRGVPQGGGSGSHLQQQQQQKQQQQQQHGGMGGYDAGPYGKGGGGGYLPQQQQNPYAAGGRNPYEMGGGMDASSMNDPSQQQGGPAGAGTESSSIPLDMATLSAADDDTVPTVFRWEHGGRQVYITGTFNGWSRQIPMHRSGNDFTYIHNLKRGKHAFKFIVDDEWRFAPDQPTVADIEGRINNFIDVTDFKAYTGDRDFEKEKAAAEYGCYPDPSTTDHEQKSGVPGDDASKANRTDSDAPGSVAAPVSASSANKPDRDGEIFSHNMPDLDEYTKEPPPLPPHLRHIILNKPPQLQDTAALPVPQHVALNHLYCTAIKDNMMVLGITQRFKTKFVTTVYYSPCKN
uniref:Association with the SNF1 complex (ASC) domain-containing protein n=1 Tax=Ditylum brightwellii TaxID=49249 RepID=A0A6S8RT73_9STRA|mmetsp:Transcript_28327/g.41125  ORF Transcript_28327/g.41125 Transcript_28327/m.41125 type:complete len:395 (+) Transcript_28327:77-1261(+)